MKARSGSAGTGGVLKEDAKRNMEAEELYRKYGPMVTRRCRQLLGNNDDTADAVQDVFVKLMVDGNLKTVEFPSSLLWRIATNHCLNVLRDKARRSGSEDGETLLERIACSDCDNNIEDRVSFGSVLGKLFGKHPESTRTIAVLHLVDGMTLEETAREVGMSMSGVRKRLSALREDLKIMEVI